MRDHQPVVIDRFNGLWRRGDVDDTPLDHFADCNNMDSFGQKGFGHRAGVDVTQDILLPLDNIKRIYNYPTATSNGLIVLTYDGVTGNVYYYVNATTTHGPIITIAVMEDIAFVPINGRGYISPFKTYPQDGINFEKGMSGEFLYVYKGDGTAARKAAGATPAGTITVANGAAGHTDAGTHVFGVVGETDTGYLSAPYALNSFVTTDNLSVSFSTVPVLVGAQWIRRHIVASKVIVDYNGDTTGYQLFFIPGAIINDNVTTVLANISFFDADLLEDASHLLDNFAEIAAGACLGLYHNRLCLGGQFVNPHLIRVSEVGEPEAFNQIEGILTMPADGNPVTQVAELRDVIYGFKRSKTASWVDNGDVPTSWPYVAIDEGLGTCVHGIATHLDSGSSVADFLFVATYKGLCLFNGRYTAPELSWKIQDAWFEMDRNEFRKIQMLDDPIGQAIYYVTTDRGIMKGDYRNGMTPKDIRWWPWTFEFKVNTIGILNIDTFIIGADQV